MAEKKKPCKKKSADDVSRELILKAMGADADKMYGADQRLSISGSLSTGFTDLDRLMLPMYYASTGKGGLPLGFVAEFFGPNAGGKSSTAFKLAADATKYGGFVIHIDAEASFVREWAEMQGVDLSRMQIIQPGETGEFYLRKVDTLAKIAKQANIKLIIVDSITALVPHQIKHPKKEDDSKDNRVGLRAKMLTDWLPKIAASARIGDCAVILINQIRDKVGVVWGNPETTPGGHAAEFAASLRLRVARVGSKDDRQIIKDDETIGVRSTIKIIKSRFGPADKETVIPIFYTNVRPEPLDAIINAAMSSGIVKSKTKKTEDGDSYQTFTFKPSKDADKIEGDGIEGFKKALNDDSIISMAEQILEVGEVTLEADAIEYLKSLGFAGDETETPKAEGDSGEAGDLPPEDESEPEVPVK